MPPADFCHLHVHTQFSLLDGACRIEQIAEKAAACGMPAVAMTDHGNLFGAVQFADALPAHGVKPIIGYEAYLTPGSRHEHESTGRRQDLHHLTLLAADETGFTNLLRMASLAYLEGFYYKPRVDWELLEGCAAGLVCMTGCLQSRLNEFLLTGQEDEAARWLGQLRDLFGPERLYVELQDGGLPDQKRVLGPAAGLAARLGVPVVATNDCHYMDHDDRDWHDVLLAINTHSTLDAPDRFRLESDQLYFKTPEEMGRVFADYPEALRNTVRVAEMCTLALDRRRKYPAFRQEGVPPAENPRLLRRLCEQGLRERYGERAREMQARLDEELAIIEQMGYVDYFLIVWDFVRFARQNEIPVGLRGSGVGSLAAHALGMTPLNPMDYGLLFSRFLDPQRQEAPDIDIDLCEQRRGEVIDYVRARYGEHQTAQIITYGTLKARNSVRDVGRVMGVPLDKVDRVAKMIPPTIGMTLETALEQVSDLAALAQQDEEVARVIKFAQRIEGLPRHAGVHAAGVVIADRPLWEMVPLAKSADGAIITQWAMDDLTATGMLKIDFLGLSTLTIVDKTLRNIAAGGRKPPSLDVADLDLNDPETYRVLTQGVTSGVFQFGSEGMKRLLERLEPRSFEDLIAVVALFRPGPLQSGMVENFINGRHGRGEVSYPHPAFEPILEGTHGVILYQEQIMRIANSVAAMSMADALTMIKAISKKKRPLIQRFHEDFVNGAVASGVDRETAESVFDLILHFAGYGFNKAHASGYAFVAFITAFLEAHYPAEFMAASLTVEMGNAEKLVQLMDDCRRLGIEVLPPDVNESVEEFAPVGDRRIRFGLGAVKNAGSRAVECLVAARQEGGPFANLFDFCERVDAHEVSKGALEALVKAGCFDALPGTRAQQMAVLETAVRVGTRERKNRRVGQKSLFGATAADDPAEHMKENLPDVPPLSPQALAQQENEALGMYVRYDPLVGHRDKLRRFCTATSAELASLPEGAEAVMGGMVEKLARRTTRSGEAMAVLKVLDTAGTFECVLFPRAFEAHVKLVEEGRVLFFAGRVSHARATSLQADAVLPLERAHARLARALLVSVQCEEASEKLWAELRAVLAEHRGRVPVFIDLVGGGFRLRSHVQNGLTVDASDELADAIERLVGTGRVRFAIECAEIRQADRRPDRQRSRRQ